MRASAIRLGLAVVLVTATASGALAGPGAKDPDQIDIDQVKAQLTVLSDGQGHFIVLKPSIRGDTHFYYGDGTTFHNQRVIGGGSSAKNKRFSAYFWAPRSSKGRAEINLADGVWRLTCDKRATVMSPLPAADAERVLDRGRFMKPLWHRTVYSLSRDRRGTYYFVDRLKDEYGGRGYRLWVGQRGAMKRQKMINIVSDSEGDIFATKRGDLRLILDKKDATWVKGRKSRALTYVPPRRNIYLIYVELGVYTQKLGTPCDDL